MAETVSREQVIRFRIRASHLDRKLPPGSFAEAAWGGLQDSVPRGGVIGLHARVEDTQPDAWEDRSLAQIWFRGADYIVPRAEAGVFTLGTLPRDPDAVAALERVADEIHRVTEGRRTSVADVVARLALESPIPLRQSSRSGRVHIRWDASRIWLIPVERAPIDPEDARHELARRFLHWFGPATLPLMTRWTGVGRDDAAATWRAIERELVAVRLGGDERYVLASDVDLLVAAEPVAGVRLLPWDDALTKHDHELLVVDDELRGRVLPPVGTSLGYIPGAVLVDGEIVGAWQRQQRRVRIHPWWDLPGGVRDSIEQEALAFPIAGSSKPSVTWA